MGGQPAHGDGAARHADRLPLVESPRPLLWPALGLMAGIWISEEVGEIQGSGRWLATGFPALVVVALFFAGRVWAARPPITVMLLCVLALGVGFVRHQTVTAHPPQHVAHVLTDEPLLTRLTGEIVVTPVWQPQQLLNPYLAFDPPGRTRFVLALREFGTTDPPTPAMGCVRVGISGEPLDLRLGDLVELTGKLYRPRGPQNPGEIDWARWNRLQGIDVGLSVEGPQYVRRIGSHESWFRRLVGFARRTSRSLLLEPYADLGADDVARLLDTMVLGQRTSADRALNEAFLGAGVIHALSVSGFHIAVLAGAAWWLTRRVLRTGSTIGGAATLVVVLAYTLVAEPNAPILRSAIAGVLASLAILSRRPICPINWLAFAAMCILAYDPLELFRAAFQLSFVQVLALVTLVPPIYRLAVAGRGDEEASREARTLWQLGVQRTWRALVGLVVVSVVLWLVALPLVLLHFQRFTPWGVLGTVVLSVPISAIICLSFVTLLLNVAIPRVGHWFGVVLAWATEWLLHGVGLFEKLPGAVIEARPPPVWFVVVTYALLLALITHRRSSQTVAPLNPQAFRRAARRRRVRWVTGLALGLAWLAWPFLPRLGGPPSYNFHMLSVGNGSATVVTTPGGSSAVFDAGTDRNQDTGETVARALRALGVRRPEFLCVSHDNFDHYSGVPTLVAQVPVPRLLINPYFQSASEVSPAVRRWFKLLAPYPVPVATIHAGDRLTVGEMQVEVLWPAPELDPQVWRTNDRSLVLRLHAGGRTVLIPGDIERAAMRALLDADVGGRVQLAADVLIAPHHGSVILPDTRAFLAAVNPEIVVVSSATARPKLVALVRETLGPACRLVTTGEVGAVRLDIAPGGEIRVQTPFAPTE